MIRLDIDWEAEHKKRKPSSYYCLQNNVYTFSANYNCFSSRWDEQYHKWNVNMCAAKKQMLRFCWQNKTSYACTLLGNIAVKYVAFNDIFREAHTVTPSLDCISMFLTILWRNLISVSKGSEHFQAIKLDWNTFPLIQSLKLVAVRL